MPPSRLLQCCAWLLGGCFAEPPTGDGLFCGGRSLRDHSPAPAP